MKTSKHLLVMYTHNSCRQNQIDSLKADLQLMSSTNGENIVVVYIKYIQYVLVFSWAACGVEGGCD